MRKPIPYGRFLLLDRIAVGGMAEVYVAIRRGEPAGRLYALKRILPTLAEDAEFITMFLDEARLVVQLDHPAIVPIHELGMHGEGYYIAMDYLPGKDLRALLDRLRARGEPMPVPLAAHVAARVADALDHAHRKRDALGSPLRVVHRDVSPANVLLGFDGSVRIIDFGIAQAALRTRRQDTVLRGKFGYMSPEMVRGQPVDHRSDVFSLGVVLHEMLTGARLFSGKSELSVLERVRRAEVPPPSRARPGLPPELDAIVLRALARDPAQRFEWASDLRDALLAFTHGVPPDEPPGDPPALARTMAVSFPGELRAELDRLEKLRAAPAPAREPSPPERTQVIAVRPDEPPASGGGADGADGGLAAPPFFRLPEALAAPAPSRPALVSGRTAAAAGFGALVAVAAVLAFTGPRRPQPPGAPVAAAPVAAAPAIPTVSAAPAAPQGRTAPGRPATGRISVQARVAATLVLDGEAQRPPLGAGEVRTLEVTVGRHRVEFRTEDGFRAGATVEVRAGETAELLGVALE
ncbi:serine/threonine protein kinase [Anaeromyxobacter dehalogenans 2CP-1]|uniref:Serine/threonine protein kinase n=1 Tax=Anaeromyxobacter dehalogenans (strain ATCC BAA-258 / DSM 21875 / 2CP-1) TaxID=455488 RepID=B8JGD7_ANAD2|nr:serine/threonine-protein kinase [Anaeromyxobacter dehalogenans]ACL64608.1 serine/threonine protein kinase [Anaeromyxobacter dehalogenans 2CP-1]